MIFRPHNLIKSENNFIFYGEVNAIAHPCLNKDIIKEFWRNFSFGCSTLNVSECDKFIFSIGNTKALPLDGADYSINIDEGGVCVCAENEKNLIYGFVTLLDRFSGVDREDSLAVKLDCCQIKESPLIKNRMVHFCVFPETELWVLKRFVRFCGALKFTHIVLEFWGMLKYDCMNELAWSFAFTKEQIRPIINEANDLGLEIIPMFNHWGHASACRICSGKHVVLDQNHSLQTYFTDDGWCWDIRKPKVKDLLRKIRKELTELFEGGRYIHLGCDEAYNFELNKENMDFICGFINEISEEMKQVGRKIIIWGDIFLYRHPDYNSDNKYTCNAPSQFVEQYLLEHLSKDVVIADWQYSATSYPIETSDVFTKAGFDCLLCPWDRGEAQMYACLDTVKNSSLMGIMHTTWHTIQGHGYTFVLRTAAGCFESPVPLTNREARTAAASLLRKVMPSNGDYEKSGSLKFQITHKSP